MIDSSAARSAPSPILLDSGVTGVKCNGGNAALGHPEVYYSFSGQSQVCCFYCGQIFRKV